MRTLSTTASCAMAGVLLWAGLEKLRHSRTAAHALIQLGLAHRLSGLAGYAVITLAFVEIAAALALIAAPASFWTQGLIATLAAVFAIAGWLAHRSDTPVRCGCFGGGGSGRLGLMQVAAFPVWLGAIALVRLGDWPSLASGDWSGEWTGDPFPDAAAMRFAAVALMLAAIRAIAVSRAWRDAAGDRRSAEEMYQWLSPR